MKLSLFFQWLWNVFIDVLLSVVGAAVAFFKEMTGRDDSRDHSGYQSFVGAVRSVALQVTLWFNSWLSLLQHSPTC